jgi:hypothetical protein
VILFTHIFAFIAAGHHLVARFTSVVVFDIDNVWALAVRPSVLNLFPWSSAFPTAAGGIKSGNIFLTLNTFTVAALVAEFEGAGAFGTCLVVFNRLEVVFSKASCALST